MFYLDFVFNLFLIKCNFNVNIVTEEGDEKWQRFISLLGEKIRLRGWNRFRGGLDVKGR